jgi:hypothetical protein
MTHPNPFGYWEFVIEDTMEFRVCRVVRKGENNERGV